MLRRWYVFDGLKNEHLSERFLFRRDAEDMRDAIEFLYVLEGLKTGEPVDPFYYPLIEVRHA